MDRSYEFHPPASNWLARAYHTPLRDALRGQLSARLDVRREIAAADLPHAISGLIYTVVRRTRLWRSEKIDVARELATHFADGLATGRSSEQLIDAFGSPERAAGLIRKAKRRGRPLYWQTWWYVSRSVLVLLGVAIVGYGVLAARFYLSAPTIAHNYWHEINDARRVPEAERAWPLYREAIFKLGRDDSFLIGMNVFAEPHSKQWPKLVAALERGEQSIDLAREAARKPALGFYLGDPADNAAARDADAEWILSSNSPVADENDQLVAALLPHAQVLRELARLLAADARRAAVAGDGRTVLADLTALMGMSQQIFEPHATLVEQLVGIAIFGTATDTAGRILADQPEALSEAQLRDLAHELAAYRDGTIHMDLTGERDMFYDALQRIYTDDGKGRGRITAEGIRVLNGLASSAPPALNPDKSYSLLTNPGFAALVGTRQETRDLYDSLLDEMIAAHQGPPWRWDYDATHAADERLEAISSSPAGKLRYFLTQLFLPGIGAVFSADQRAIQNRDAAEVAVALVLWHRRHGQWPESLDHLVPDLLPAVPRDRFDGKPFRYAVRDGQPILYSTGIDHDDDGGRPAEPPENALGPFGPDDPEDKNPHPAGTSDDGDWILWPPVKEPELEETP